MPAMPHAAYPREKYGRKSPCTIATRGMVECGDWSWNRKATDSRCVVGFIPSHDAFGMLGPKLTIVYR